MPGVRSENNAASCLPRLLSLNGQVGSGQLTHQAARVGPGASAHSEAEWVVLACVHCLATSRIPSSFESEKLLLHVILGAERMVFQGLPLIL